MGFMGLTDDTTPPLRGKRSGPGLRAGHWLESITQLTSIRRVAQRPKHELVVWVPWPWEMCLSQRKYTAEVTLTHVCPMHTGTTHESAALMNDLRMNSAVKGLDAWCLWLQVYGDTNGAVRCGFWCHRTTFCFSSVRLRPALMINVLTRQQSHQSNQSSQRMAHV